MRLDEINWYWQTTTRRTVLWMSGRESNLWHATADGEVSICSRRILINRTQFAQCPRCEDRSQCVMACTTCQDRVTFKTMPPPKEVYCQFDTPPCHDAEIPCVCERPIVPRLAAFEKPVSITFRRVLKGE